MSSHIINIGVRTKPKATSYSSSGGTTIISTDGNNSGSTSGDSARFNNATITQLDAGTVNAQNVYVNQTLKAENAIFNNVNAENIDASNGNFEHVVTNILDASTATINELMGEWLKFKDASIGTLDSSTINSIWAYLQYLYANNIDASTATIDKELVVGSKDSDDSTVISGGSITTKNLSVTGFAHFFELIIDKIKSVGGAILITPANGFEIALVEKFEALELSTDNHAFDAIYRLYFYAAEADINAMVKDAETGEVVDVINEVYSEEPAIVKDAEDGSDIYSLLYPIGYRKIENMWRVGDQAVVRSFNDATKGINYNAHNSYYWSLVIGVDEEPVVKGTRLYHYIDICAIEAVDSSSNATDGVVEPEIGDNVAMLGYRGTDDPARQSALYLSAYSSLDHGLTAPLMAEYKGINDYDLASHRHSYFDANGAKFIGDISLASGFDFGDIEDRLDGIEQTVSELQVNSEGIELRVTAFLEDASTRVSKLILNGEGMLAQVRDDASSCMSQLAMDASSMLLQVRNDASSYLSQLNIDSSSILAQVRDDASSAIAEIKVAVGEIDIQTLKDDLETAGIHLDGENSKVSIVGDRFETKNTSGQVTSWLDSSSNLHVTNGVFSGTIDSSNGHIGGFEITGSHIGSADTGGTTNGMSLWNDFICFNKYERDSGNNIYRGRQSILGTFDIVGSEYNMILRNTGTALQGQTIPDYSHNCIVINCTDATYNNAMVGTGDVKMNGSVIGYAYNEYSFTVANSYTSIPLNKAATLFVKCNFNNCLIQLPNKTAVQHFLSISSSTKFAFPIKIIAHYNNSNGFYIYGRAAKDAYFNYDDTVHTDYNTSEYPKLIDNSGADQWRIGMANGDVCERLLVYDGTEYYCVNIVYNT